MGTYTTPLKTHSRTVLTEQFNVNPCAIHNCKPVVLDVVAGKNKEHHYVVVCLENDICNKISMESAKAVVEIWNQYNPTSLTSATPKEH